MVLAFQTRQMEEAFTRRRNLQLLRNDASWLIFWLALGMAGFGKWITRGAFPPLTELFFLVAYSGWSPLLLYLIRHRAQWYVRHRNALLVTMRFVRTSLVMAHLEVNERLWVGGADSMPSSPLKAYTHLCYKINVLLLSSVGVVLPIRLYLPCQFPSLLLMLRATAQRCLQECGSDSGSALAAGTCSAGISGPGPAGDSCVAGSQAAVRYYSTAAKWIRKLNPHCLGRLPARWRPGGTVAGTCLGTCFAVQSWLQAVGGVLLPLALLWFWEERLRARELRLWQQQLRLQYEQLQQQGEQQADAAAAAAPCPQQAGQQPPLTVSFMLAWFAISCWALWLLMEAMLL